jgi:hypothetical protein
MPIKNPGENPPASDEACSNKKDFPRPRFLAKDPGETEQAKKN